MSGIYIASFDIGKKNFAFCIEEVEVTLLKEVSPVKNGYNPDGTCTEDLKAVLEVVYKSGRVILHKNTDLTKGITDEKKSCVHPELYQNMYDLLDEYSTYWDKCSYFIIEEQMSFGKRLNLMAVKLGQHCYSYFVYRYGRFGKIVREFHAYHKTQVLGAPKIKGKVTKKGVQKWVSMEKSQRKKWSVKVAQEILSLRGEEGILLGLATAKKKDDLADVLTQLQAFKYLFYVCEERI